MKNIVEKVLLVNIGLLVVVIETLWFQYLISHFKGGTINFWLCFILVLVIESGTSLFVRRMFFMSMLIAQLYIMFS